MHHKVRNWLAEKSSCAVDYSWRDLGPRWYPRFLAVGKCDRSQSCSIPSGMFCKESHTKNIDLLR